MAIKGYSSHVSCLTYSPDGKTIASGFGNGDGYLWDAHTGEHTATLKKPVVRTRHYPKVQFIKYSLDGNTLITGHSSEIDDDLWSRYQVIRFWEVRKRLLQTRTRKPKSSIYVLNQPIFSMVQSPNDKLIATISKDMKLNLWNAKDGRKAGILADRSAKTRAVVFSPDGTLLAGAGKDLSIRLWDLKTKQIKTTLKLHGRFENRDANLDFSPDGKVLANVTGEDTVQLWDVATGKKYL